MGTSRVAYIEIKVAIGFRLDHEILISNDFAEDLSIGTDSNIAVRGSSCKTETGRRVRQIGFDDD